MPTIRIGPKSEDWLLQHDFPQRNGSVTDQECLQNLKSDTPPAVVALFGAFNSKETVSTASNVHFQISPSPLAPVFRVEHTPYYQKGGKMTVQQKQDYQEKRATVEFAAWHSGESMSDSERGVIYEYKGKAGNIPPPGPHSFSTQLFEVQYMSSEASKLPNVVKDLPGKHHVFVWRSKSCTKYAFDQPMTGDRQKATNSFKDVIQHGLRTDDTTWRFFVAFKQSNSIPNVYWPYFAASPPSHVLAPYWPWVGELDKKDKDSWKKLLHPATSDGTLEQHPLLIKKLLARREKGWQNTAENADLPALKLEIASQFRSIRFREGRQYLAMVLGSYYYEDAYATTQRNVSFNGMHRCDIYSQDGIVEGTKRYLVLVNPQPQHASQEADLHADLPSIGEQVQINIEFGRIDQIWQGTVVDIPVNLRTAGRGVAIEAFSEPFVQPIGRIVVSPSTHTADFMFGQHAQILTKLRQRTISLMATDNFKTKASFLTATILKEMLLAQDLWHFNATHNGRSAASANALVGPFRGRDNMLAHIRQVCSSRKPPLTQKQTDIVEHYFTHIVTLVRGPPGTGKTTLIDVIAQLEHEFDQKYWMCAESNAACNVLVEKAVTRLRTAQPAQMLRVKPSTNERFDFTSKLNSLEVEPLSITSDQDDTAALEQAVRDFLSKDGNIEQAMGLENLMKQRVQYWQRSGNVLNRTQEAFTGESKMLDTLSQTAIAFQNIKLQLRESRAEFVARRQQLEQDYFNALSRLQVAYVGCTKGVYSTAAASSGRLLGKYAPHGMVMDEASQFQEASAVGAILFAAEQGQLRRIMLIGDDLQLPPTIMSPRNTFAETSKLSLFERLIKAGMQPLTLDTQYRMEPTISRASKELIYQPISVNLRDGDNTASHGGAVQKFRKFLVDFASSYGKQKLRSDTNSIIVSPAAWTGDVRTNITISATGSTSKYNLGSAWIVAHAIFSLLKFGYQADDIMVISFYTDQVNLLKSMFSAETLHGEPLVNKMLFTTVDGSQGRERKITIVDTVLQGAANKDGMGFLGSEKRRFNVGMSRAQSGRILVANERMVTNDKDKSVWGTVIKQATGAILQGRPFQTAIPNRERNASILGQMQKFHQRAQNKSDSIPHRTGETNIKHPDPDFARSAFMRATHATLEIASDYLDRYKNDIPAAIDMYLSYHGSDDIPVEEIRRGN